MNDTNSAGQVLEQTDFVRGRIQLAPFFADKEATGHRLKAYEAREAYGSATLEEAIEFGSAVLASEQGAAASSLRRQREELGVTADDAERVLRLPVSQLESDESGLPIQLFEKLALKLGLDERLLSFDLDAGADRELGVRLKTLQAEPQTQLSSTVVLHFAEAASIIRIQNRLTRWLELPLLWDGFERLADYGDYANPAFKIGYDLAGKARKQLGLGNQPISSMRDLVEERLGIPVLQRALPPRIAGATVSNGADRGVIINTVGRNSSVWVRRATLAHELEHLLFDPEQQMGSVRVDSYDETDLDPETKKFSDFVEQRANAFAIEFLAPADQVRELVKPPFAEEDIAAVMETFGISFTAARYHVANCYWRQYDTPTHIANIQPSETWNAAEDYALDYFRPDEVPHNRRGRFAGIVAACYQRGLISSDTAALYLECTVDAFERDVIAIVELFPLP